MEPRKNPLFWLGLALGRVLGALSAGFEYAEQQQQHLRNARVEAADAARAEHRRKAPTVPPTRPPGASHSGGQR